MKLRLDDLYKMTAFIYHDSNMGRSKEATLLHFVEVCGMLTLLDRKKHRDNVDVPGALCKALGWYFPLLAKMGVESLEALLFSKYPLVCPYCRKAPHVEHDCKLLKGTDRVLSHDEVRALTDKNWEKRPASLNEWQQMFADIYPRSYNAPSGFSTIALLEELGEIAEAVRVFDRYPHYFYGEAADAFSYLMGLANEYQLQCISEGRHFDYEIEFIARYPGLCIACGAKVCVCPTVPAATVGRMAKEMPLKLESIADIDAFEAAGRTVAEQVLENVGRIPGLTRNLPFDRGDMNAGLTQLAFRLAMALENEHQELSGRLYELAVSLGREKRESGTEAHSLTVDVLDLLKQAWVKADPATQHSIESEQASMSSLTHLLDTNVLIITSNPTGANNVAVRLDREIRKIRERILMGSQRDRIKIDHLAAATVSDVRRALLTNSYDLVHFAGHASSEGLDLEGEGESEGETHLLEWDVFARMLNGQSALKCVVLNACSAMQGLNKAFAPLVIGMVDEIDDEASLIFATGYYDALAAGQSPSMAYDVAVTALQSADFSPHIVAKLTGDI